MILSVSGIYHLMGSFPPGGLTSWFTRISCCRVTDGILIGDNLSKSCCKRLVNPSSVTTALGWSLKSIQRPDNGDWVVTIEGDDLKPVRARYLLDCSGRRAMVATKLGSRRNRIYSLIGYWKIFNDPSENSDQERVLLTESSSYGWWYTAPIPGKKRMVIFFTDQHAPFFKQLLDPEFYRHLLTKTTHIKHRVKNNQPAGHDKVNAVVVESGHLDRYCGNHWMAAGDAAMSFDPVSAQGIPNALYTGIEAAKVVESDLIHQSGNHDYQLKLSSIWNNYLVNCRSLYVQERRWLKSPFWKSKHHQGIVPDQSVMGFERPTAPQL